MNTVALSRAIPAPSYVRPSISFHAAGACAAGAGSEATAAGRRAPSSAAARAAYAAVRRMMLINGNPLRGGQYGIATCLSVGTFRLLYQTPDEDVRPAEGGNYAPVFFASAHSASISARSIALSSIPASRARSSM